MFFNMVSRMFLNSKYWWFKFPYLKFLSSQNKHSFGIPSAWPGLLEPQPIFALITFVSSTLNVSYQEVGLPFQKNHLFTYVRKFLFQTIHLFESFKNWFLWNVLLRLHNSKRFLENVVCIKHIFQQKLIKNWPALPLIIHHKLSNNLLRRTTMNNEASCNYILMGLRLSNLTFEACACKYGSWSRSTDQQGVHTRDSCSRSVLEYF